MPHLHCPPEGWAWGPTLWLSPTTFLILLLRGSFVICNYMTSTWHDAQLCDAIVYPVYHHKVHMCRSSLPLPKCGRFVIRHITGPKMRSLSLTHSIVSREWEEVYNIASQLLQVVKGVEMIR